MDGSTLSHHNIQFTRSHTGKVLITSLILQRWQSQACSWLRRNFSMCTSSKMGYVATLSHDNRQPLQGTPAMIRLCSPLHPTSEGCQGEDIQWQQQPQLLWLLTSPTLDPSVKASLDKGIGTPKSPSGDVPSGAGAGEARTAQTLYCWGWEILGIFFFLKGTEGKHCSPLQ